MPDRNSKFPPSFAQNAKEGRGTRRLSRVLERTIMKDMSPSDLVPFVLLTARAILLAFLATGYAFGQTLNLWPGVAPGSESWTQKEQIIENTPVGTVVLSVTTPTLTAYVPDKSKATGTGIIVAPGGACGALVAGERHCGVCPEISHSGEKRRGHSEGSEHGRCLQVRHRRRNSSGESGAATCGGVGHFSGAGGVHGILCRSHGRHRSVIAARRGGAPEFCRDDLWRPVWRDAGHPVKTAAYFYGMGAGRRSRRRRGQ